MKAELIPTDKITVPDFVERPLSKVADDRDRQSIQKSGIQQPLVCIEDGKRTLLVKGLRRLRIARSLGIGKVPVVFATVPRGREVEEYVRELRLALDMHRQDLLPSQKCQLVETLKERFSMTNVQVAAYLGIDADSVTNWLAVKGYIAPVSEALDAGRLTMQNARVFIGMTPEGQEMVWRVHRGDLVQGTGAKLHKEIRRIYTPKDFPQFYRNANVTTERLARTSGKRRKVARVGLTTDEKRRLNASLEMKEIELREFAEDEKRMKAEINAAIAPVNAIMRNEKLRQLVPADMLPELERFVEIY